jgi:hypothetical protein
MAGVYRYIWDIHDNSLCITSNSPSDPIHQECNSKANACQFPSPPDHRTFTLNTRRDQDLHPHIYSTRSFLFTASRNGPRKSTPPGTFRPAFFEAFHGGRSDIIYRPQTSCNFFNVATCMVRITRCPPRQANPVRVPRFLP